MEEKSLKLIRETETRNHRKYGLYLCYCGKEKELQIGRVNNGYVKSCGCLQKTKASNSCKSRAKHNLNKTRLYKIWKNMRQRCNNPKASGYKNYGGKGITVCEEWNDFLNFKTWAEANNYEDNLEIDRIDSDKNYCPNNCRWVTKSFNLSMRNKDERNLGKRKSKLSKNDILNMQNDKKNGMTLKQLAEKYCCSISHCSRVLKNEPKYLGGN